MRRLTSITAVLGFELLRREREYVLLCAGIVTLGLGPISKLPFNDGYFTGTRRAEDRRASVETVLGVDDLTKCHKRVLASGHPILHTLREQPWDLTDFRIIDPDGYSLRITSRE